MVLGFNESDDFSPVVGWELYEVTLNKYHVMFLEPFQGIPSHSDGALWLGCEKRRRRTCPSIFKEE